MGCSNTSSIDRAKAKLVNKYARGALAYSCCLVLHAVDGDDAGDDAGGFLAFSARGNVLSGHDVRNVTVSGADVAKMLRSGARSKYFIEWMCTQLEPVHDDAMRLVT